MKVIAGLVSAVGVVVLVVACVLGFRVLPDYIDSRIEKEVSLVPHSETWNKWVEIERPIYFNVYVFNVTNPDDYENGSQLPALSQVGPYAYKQMRRKKNLTQLNGERTVTYEQEIYYIFDQEASGENKEEDLVNVFNIAYVMLISGIYILNPQLATGLANEDTGLLVNETIIRRDVAVGDLIFQGYDGPKFEFLGSLLPEEFRGGFAIYKNRNGSTDGIYTIHTGVGDSSQFGNVLLWNGDSDLNTWANLSQCDRIKGTDGSIFPPFVEKNRIVQIFSTDLCRSLHLTYQKDIELFGIKGYRFAVPAEALADPRTNQDNRCYCLEEDVENCLSSGVIDVSICRSGAPIVLSTPYFLHGNQNYSARSGLWAKEEWHETYVDIEKNSGVLLGAHKRIQVNVNFKRIPALNFMAAPLEMIFPIIWVDEHAGFTVDNAAELKDKLLSPKKAVETWRWVGLGVGIFLILGGMGIYVVKG